MAKENIVKEPVFTKLYLPSLGIRSMEVDLNVLKESRTNDLRGYATSTFQTENGSLAAIANSDNSGAIMIDILLSDTTKKSKGKKKGTTNLL
jgi:hypothetical protein